MVFRDWNAYQDALGEYERLLTGFEKEEETWTKDLQEIQERKGVTPWGCLTFILATFVGLCAESWDVVLCIFLVYGFARVYGNRGRRIRRFERRNPRPVFNYSKPEFRPPEESEAQKPQQNELTLSAARELLELGGQCSDEELKQAYRQKIRQYHPDMVATLGKELREMAEAMTKRINEAYELLRSCCQFERSAPRHGESPGSAKTDDAFHKSPIYPKEAIVCGPASGRGQPFIRGPFEGFEDERFCEPYEEGIDYVHNTTREYLTINSWRGRIKHGEDSDAVLSNQLFELAELGGWDGNHGYHEVFGGGADVIPENDCKRISAALKNILASNREGFVVGERTVSREIVEKASEIFDAGPTTVPW
jgi:DnaJ like chaperone protein